MTWILSTGTPNQLAHKRYTGFAGAKRAAETFLSGWAAKVRKLRPGSEDYRRIGDAITNLAGLDEPDADGYRLDVLVDDYYHVTITVVLERRKD